VPIRAGLELRRHVADYLSEQAEQLIHQAESHGVLGALLRNFSPFKTDAAFASAYDAARGRHRQTRRSHAYCSMWRIH